MVWRPICHTIDILDQVYDQNFSSRGVAAKGAWGEVVIKEAFQKHLEIGGG